MYWSLIPINKLIELCYTIAVSSLFQLFNLIWLMMRLSRPTVNAYINSCVCLCYFSVSLAFLYFLYGK